METLDELVEEALWFLQINEPPDGYLVGFSGGKDSIVTKSLCELAGVKHRAVYSVTRLDPPEIVRFIKQHYPAVEWAFPKRSFWSLIMSNDPPTFNRRWCCRSLKKRPTAKDPLRSRVQGIRAEESTKRAARKPIELFEKMKQTVYKPVFYWKEWAVWEYIESRGLAFPSLYSEGFDRVGCVICPYIINTSNQDQLYRNMVRWPGMFKAFEAAVDRWFTTYKGRRSATMGFDTTADYLAAYYWAFSRTKRGTGITCLRDALELAELLT